MDKNYDLDLPSWGPYNKHYLGVSHIPGSKYGIRYDINLFPGYYRSNIMIPKDNVDSGTKVLGSSTDVSHYSYRYELEWRDKVYCDVDFYAIDTQTCKIVCNFINNTNVPQSLSLNLCASMQKPTHYRRQLEEYSVSKDDNVVWIDAIDYKDIGSDCLMAIDGLYLAECRGNGFVHGSGIGSEFFWKENHFLLYDFSPVHINGIGIRYRSEQEVPVTFKTRDNTYSVTLPRSAELSFYHFPAENEYCGFLKIMPHGVNFDIDGIALGSDLKNIDFVKTLNNDVPDIKHDGKSIFLSYEGNGQHYSITWDYDDCCVRELIGENPGEMLSDSIHDHVSSKIHGRGQGHFTDLFLRPVFMDPKSERKITFVVRNESKGITEKKYNHDLFEFNINESGKTYEFSQKIMAANTLANVTYPIYCRKKYMRHNTPGKQWDSLYTWDCGFLGMGLNVMDVKRAVECLNAYLTPLNDKHSPFIFHGSVVPTQIFLYSEIWNKSQSVEFLKTFYPYIKQYYDFFANMRNDSKQMESGILKTWHIFYNSGGWDDYPPQQFVHSQDITGFVSPVITTAITILCGKILKQVAKKLNYNKDIEQFDKEIKFYSDALQRFSWDEKSGYFGYVVHNENKEPAGILRTPRGVNYNMGMDGVYPYIADICTKEQEERILSHITEGMLTKYGVSVVDTRAPYYRKNGYWNGSIWMPHQWILWKSLLDHGKIGLANHIANTALKIWKTEVELSYNCYEHFMIQNGRGAGFHQFTGLSSPVLMWYQAYFVRGNITGGFQTFIDRVIWNEDYSCVEFNVSSSAGSPFLIICMNDTFEYSFLLNNAKLNVVKLYKGTYILKLPDMKSCTYTVRASKISL